MAVVEKIKNKLRGNGFLLAVTIVLFFVLYIAGAILYGDRNFTSPQVFLNLFISNAGLIIAAVGMTFVLITGGIDISIGSVIGVVCMMLAWMMEVKHMSAVVAIILVLVFGVIFGFKNTAIYLNTRRNVLCKRSYSIDQLRYDQY